MGRISGRRHCWRGTTPGTVRRAVVLMTKAGPRGVDHRARCEPRSDDSNVVTTISITCIEILSHKSGVAVTGSRVE